MNFNQFRDIINKYFQLSMVSKLLKLDLSGKLFLNTKLNLNTIINLFIIFLQSYVQLTKTIKR